MKHLALAMAAAMLAACSAAAQTAPGPRLRRDDIGKLTFSLDLDYTRFCQRDVEGQSAAFGADEYALRFSLPVAQAPGRHDVSLFGTVGLLDIDTSAVLPTTGGGFPGELWDLQVGVVGRMETESGMFAASVSLGSPSDEPFGGWDEMSLEANALWRIDPTEQTAWVFLLNFSTNREFLPCVPIPGVAFLYHPSRQFRLTAGVPFASVRWLPMDGVDISAVYMLLRTVHAEIGYRPVKAVRVYGGFHWDSRRYLRHDRADDDHRLFYYDKRITLGVEWEVAPQVTVEATGGYAFDRFWFEGEDYDDRLTNRLDLHSGMFVGVRAKVSW
jgi:hypothetical protein